MPDEQPAEREPLGKGKVETIQRAIIHDLVDRQRPWSFAEIVREHGSVGDQADVEDALSSLQRTGLVNPVDGCYVASRAAIHVFELGILSI
jgi:hypothetical protein